MPFISMAQDQRCILAKQDRQEPKERSKEFVEVGIRGLACHDSLGVRCPWQTATGFLNVDGHNCALAFLSAQARRDCQFLIFARLFPQFHAY